MSSSIGGTSSRITGMASGLDTETLVKDLIAASRTKVETVEKKKQILEWKQELYKEVTNNLYNFQQKYFNGTSSILGNGLANMKTTSSSDLVTVTSSSSTASKLYIDDIINLASSAKRVSDAPVSADPTIGIKTDALGELAGKSLVVNLNGVEKTLTFTDEATGSAQDVQTQLQSLLDKNFGSGKVTVSLDGSTMKLSAENSTLILKTPTDETEPSAVLDFDSYASNRVDMNVSLASAGFANLSESGQYEFSINGTAFSFESTSTLNDVLTKINTSDAGVKISYSSLTDKFTMTAVDTGAASSVDIADKTGNLMGALFGNSSATAGSDAVVRLSMTGSADDLITVTRSTNTIEADGTTITLNGMADGTTAEKITVGISRDNDAIIEKIKSFVSEYNTLLSSITGKLSEEYDSDYQPLTDDEKNDMSESDIKLWNEKAKTGLLANDTYLTDIASQLRAVFYTQVSELGGDSMLGALSEIGIATTVYSDKGKLTIDETKLKNALNSNPDKVVNLFTQKSTVSYSLYSTPEQQTKRYNESGILERLSDLMNTNLNKVGNKKGALINLVGSPTDSYTGETDYSKRIQKLEDKIEDMNDALVDEENRYWKQFTAMETALAKLNQQNSWISNMLGNSNK